MTTPQEVIEDISRDDKTGLAKLIIAKLSEAGFVIVPKEPTVEMADAGEEGSEEGSRRNAVQAYRAMIARRPGQ